MLLSNCEEHAGEPIRYYCRDCCKALCAECVVSHSRHDFTAANNAAASELRRQHLITEGLVSERVTLYNQILNKTEKKLIEMEDDSKLEFKKLSMAFTELREAVFQREVVMKKELH